MLFLIIVIVLYIFLENIFKININDAKHKKVIKLISILGLSAVIVNLIYDKSLPNVIFVLLLIYIVSNTRKDSLYEFMSTIDNFESFKNQYKIDSDYYKYYRNKENSLSRVFNDKYDENHYTLDNLYPKEEEKDEKENKDKPEGEITAGYDDELENIKKRLMNKFWLIDNNNYNYKIKKKKKCNKKSYSDSNSNKKNTNKETKTTNAPQTGLCYFFDKVFGLFL